MSLTSLGNQAVLLQFVVAGLMLFGSSERRRQLYFAIGISALSFLVFLFRNAPHAMTTGQFNLQFNIKSVALYSSLAIFLIPAAHEAFARFKKRLAKSDLFEKLHWYFLLSLINLIGISSVPQAQSNTMIAAGFLCCFNIGYALCPIFYRYGFLSLLIVFGFTSWIGGFNVGIQKAPEITQETRDAARKRARETFSFSRPWADVGNTKIPHNVLAEELKNVRDLEMTKYGDFSHALHWMRNLKIISNRPLKEFSPSPAWVSQYSVPGIRGRTAIIWNRRLIFVLVMTNFGDKFLMINIDSGQTQEMALPFESGGRTTLAGVNEKTGEVYIYNATSAPVSQVYVFNIEGHTRVIDLTFSASRLLLAANELGELTAVIDSKKLLKLDSNFKLASDPIDIRKFVGPPENFYFASLVSYSGGYVLDGCALLAGSGDVCSQGSAFFVDTQGTLKALSPATLFESAKPISRDSSK